MGKKGKKKSRDDQNRRKPRQELRIGDNRENSTQEGFFAKRKEREGKKERKGILILKN